MRLLILVAVFGFLFGECSQSPPPPPPPIKQAPGHLAALRIHVQNATQHAASEAKEDFCANTIYLRGAVQRSLVRAGYRVVVSADEPNDLTARVNADWPWDKPGTATLSFVDTGGTTVDQISGLVIFDENHNIDERSAVALVEAMKHSPRLAQFARETGKPDPKPVAVTPPPPRTAAERLEEFAPAFCRKVLANDRAFMEAHTRLPLAVQTITNENMGNPLTQKRGITTIEGVAELAPCKYVMGLDPSETVPGMPKPDIRQTASGSYEVTSLIGQFEAVLEFVDTDGLFVLVGYREQ